MTTSNLFQPMIEVLSVPLADSRYNLTYEVSDNGWEADRTPWPTVYRAGYGLYLVDPGPTFRFDQAGSTQPRGPTLWRFGPNGQQLFGVALASTLDLGTPTAFQAHQIFVGEQGQCFLLYSTGDDSSREKRRVFSLAEFDAQGRLRGTLALHWYPKSDLLLRSQDGTFWSYLTAPTGKQDYWQAYDSKGARLSRVSGLSLATVLVDGRLLIFDPGNSARICTSGGKESKPTIGGSLAVERFSESHALVSGDGAFLGTLSYEYSDTHKTLPNISDGGRVTVSRLLYVYRAHNQDMVRVLGNADVPGDWAEYDSNSKDNLVRYETTRGEWYHLDAEGNLYIIVRRGPKKPAIVVYKLALREEVRERLRSALDAEK